MYFDALSAQQYLGAPAATLPQCCDDSAHIYGGNVSVMPMLASAMPAASQYNMFSPAAGARASVPQCYAAYNTAPVMSRNKMAIALAAPASAPLPTTPTLSPPSMSAHAAGKAPSFNPACYSFAPAAFFSSAPMPTSLPAQPPLAPPPMCDLSSIDVDALLFNSNVPLMSPQQLSFPTGFDWTGEMI